MQGEEPGGCQLRCAQHKAERQDDPAVAADLPPDARLFLRGQRGHRRDRLVGRVLLEPEQGGGGRAERRGERLDERQVGEIQPGFPQLMSPHTRARN